MGQQLEGVRCLARRSAGDLRFHQKAVTAVAQTVVVDDAPRAGLHPVVIQAFKHVGIMHTFRRGQMDARIADLNSAVTGRQLDGPREIDGITIRRHLDKLYRHRRGRAFGCIGIKNR